MEQVLLVAVIVLAALTLLNLLLVLGLVRRIREYEARSAMPSGPSPDVMKPVGARIGAFTTRSVDGDEVSDSTLSASSLVGFLSPSCDACHERLGDFRTAVAAHTGRSLAVVVRDGGDTDELVEALRGTATVVVEDIGGPVSTAFGVGGFPAFALVGDGKVRANGYELPLLAAT